MRGGKRINQESVFFQLKLPAGHELLDGGEVQFFVGRRVFFEVGARQLEQRGGGPQAVFLQMHKGAGQLDEALVKIAIGTVFIRKPQILKDIVRLIKELAVEAVEITEVMGSEFLSLKRFNHQDNTRAFVTHAPKI
jgi:hypothetical protein